MSISAFAEVGSVVAGGGGILPFGILSGDNTGVLCLKTGSKFPAECQANAQGNFGYLDFKTFGNGSINTTQQCTGMSTVLPAENIAHGVDHDLAIAPNSPTDDKGIDADPFIIEEDEACPSGSAVMAVKTETGNKDKVLVNGFVLGANGFPGRLTLSTDTWDFNGTPIDDKPLWEYLSDAGRTACGQVVSISGDVDTQDEIVACIEAKPTTDLFVDEIAESPRLAQVPEMWQASWPNGSKLLSIKRFQFVYVQTLYGGCKNNGSCTLQIEPGGVKQGSGTPDVVTAIAIGDSNISHTVKDSYGTPSIETFALTR